MCALGAAGCGAGAVTAQAEGIVNVYAEVSGGGVWRSWRGCQMRLEVFWEAIPLLLVYVVGVVNRQPYAM